MKRLRQRILVAVALTAFASPVLGAEAAGGFVVGEGAAWFAKIMALSFGAGLVMSLTPCVYPMIFITAAIVAGRGQKGKLSALAGSLAYVLGLSVVYGLLGLLVAALGGGIRFHLEQWYVRVPMAALFALLALGMFDILSFGFGESFVARVRTSLAGKAGLVGIFAMGAVSALAASPCLTAPLLGLLTVIAQTGNKVLGFWALFAMAWGMGLVLIIAGASTGLLPKAGGWMNWVKRLLGFVLLWAAAYFLKPVIGIPAYQVATGAVILAGAVFLGGLDRLSAESGSRERVKGAAGLIAIVLGAAVMLEGLGLLAPGAAPVATGGELAQGDPVWIEADEADHDKALFLQAPMVIDFTGDACPVCDRLDRETLRDGRVLTRIKDAGFVALKVNASREESLRERYGLQGVPTVVLLDAKGNEVDRFSGFMGPEEFLAFLAKAETPDALDALLNLPGSGAPGATALPAAPPGDDGCEPGG